MSKLTIPSIENFRETINFEVKAVGDLSILRKNKELKCFQDKRYLKTYKYSLKNRNVEFDLNEKATKVKSDGKVENVDPLLWWLNMNRESFFIDDKFTFDVLCWRGLITSIMITVLENKSDWKVVATKFKNSYFLCEYNTNMQSKKKSKLERLYSYGFKFEEYVTDRQHEGNYILMACCSIGKNKLIYGGEIDCVSPSNKELMELKVHRGNLFLDSSNKYLKWWLQTSLVNIKRIMVGSRDDSGIVYRIVSLPVSRIEDESTWSKDLILNFFDYFINFMKSHTKTNEYTEFYYSPKTRDITASKSNNKFLPNWFSSKYK